MGSLAVRIRAEPKALKSFAAAVSKSRMAAERTKSCAIRFDAVIWQLAELTSIRG